MTLSGVELFRYAVRLKEPVRLKGATLRRREGALIRLIAEDGSEGWGEAAPLPGFSPESLHGVTEQLRGATVSIMDREIPPGRPEPGDEPLPELAQLDPSARFGLELAFLNLTAASRGETLTQILASRPRNTVLTNGLLSGSPERALAEASVMRESGYRTVKLKVGRGDVAEDAGLVRGVAEVLGDGVSLRLDANRAWGLDEAFEFARRIPGVRVDYVEEPLAEPWRLAELARAWGLPVALDESLVGMGPDGLERHPYARAVVLKPTLLGGVLRALRFAGRAEALGMVPVVSSSYEVGVGTAALVALAAAVGEGPAGLDTYRALAEDVLDSPLNLPAPEVDVRETAEAARRVDVGSLEPVVR